MRWGTAQSGRECDIVRFGVAGIGIGCQKQHRVQRKSIWKMKNITRMGFIY